MLSYRHSFHAGNFADVLKHIVQVEILEYLTQKEKPFEYIDTHSGAGLFNLNSNDSQKLQEYKTGIAKLTLNSFPEINHYFDIINSFNKKSVADGFEKIDTYPGSPSIAQHFLRQKDRAWLFELHPQDYSLLAKNFSANKKIRVMNKDGLSGLLSLLPPTSRRGLVLIDPSYEVKDEYEWVVDTVIKAHKKFSTGTYAIWYPVVDRSRIDFMQRKLIQSGIKNIQQFELGLEKDSCERGMTSSGMIVINPPWTLFEKMSNLLPRLAQALADEQACFRCDILSAE